MAYRSSVHRSHGGSDTDGNTPPEPFPPPIRNEIGGGKTLVMTSRDCQMLMCQLCNSHGTGHKIKQLGDYPPPQRRMRNGITVKPILVHQTASRIMKELGVHNHAGYIRPKSRKPECTGHSPRGGGGGTFPRLFSGTWGTFPDCSVLQGGLFRRRGRVITHITNFLRHDV